MDSVEDTLDKLRGILGEGYASGHQSMLPEDVRIMNRFFGTQWGKDLANAAVDWAAKSDWMEPVSGEAFKQALSAQSPVWGLMSKWFYEVFMPIVEERYQELKSQGVEK